MKTLLILILSIYTISGFSQKNIQLRSIQTFNSDLSDVWGYVANGREYALVGVKNGLQIVDVTNPDQLDPLFFIQGFSSTWRDMHIWQDHAYVTNEKDGGLLIVDLSDLPNSIQSNTWDADSLLKTAHNLWIDENGYLYIFGFNSIDGQIPYDDRGVIIADLNNDPKNPDFINTYTANYVHDGYVRKDTMWLGEISAGFFTAVDVSDKNNLQILGSGESPGRFTHNVWPSDDGKTLFTTDEIEGGYIGAYDVSDLNNIKELTRYREASNQRPIPHNTHVLGNYLWNSYYTYGVNLVDATRPDNLVEVGRYSTSSFPVNSSFNGCWGVYPYLPSGNILASDIQEGLFVFTPTYTRACYLEGSITDSAGTMPQSGINVELVGTDVKSKSDIAGIYKMGIVDSGFYDVRISYPGCYSKIVTNVRLDKAQVTTLDFLYECVVSNVEDIDLEKMKLDALPNVFSNNTTLNFSGLKAAKGQLQIINLSGQVLKSLDLNTHSGQVVLGENLAAGMYIAVLISEKEKITKKIQKL